MVFRLFSIPSTLTWPTQTECRRSTTCATTTAHNQVESYFLLSLQCVADVAAMSQAFPMFDQLNLTSMNKELLNEDHMKSVGNLVKIITVGQGPFIQTITPHRLNNSSYFCTFYTNAPIVIEIRLLPTKKRCVCVNFQYCFQYLMFCVNDSSFFASYQGSATLLQ